jgi:hypothetical protein
MVTFIRTVGIAPGRNDQILALARQTQRLLKSRFGVDLRLQVPIGGHLNRIAFVLTFRDLAELEAMTLKITADPEYRKLSAATARNANPGSGFDEMWRDVDFTGVGETS